MSHITMCVLPVLTLTLWTIPAAGQATAPVPVATPQVGGPAAIGPPQSTQEPEIHHTGFRGEVTGVAFSPDGQRVAAGSRDGSVKLWESGTGRELQTLRGRDNQVSAVAFSPDGRLLAAASSDVGVRLWEVESGREVRTFPGTPDRRILAVVFSPDGQYLAAGDVLWSDDGHRPSPGKARIWMWEVSTGKQVLGLDADEAGVRCLAFSPDGRLLASGGEKDHKVKLWEMPGGRLRKALSGHTAQVQAVTFSSDGLRMASAGQDHTVILWGVAGWRVQRRLLYDHEWVASVAFSPDGKRVAAGGLADTIVLWDVESGTRLAKIEAHQSGVSQIGFRGDGRWLVSGSSDKTVKLWSTAEWRLLRTWMPPKVWEVTIGGMVRKSAPPAGYEGPGAEPAEEYLDVFVLVKNVSDVSSQFKPLYVFKPLSAEGPRVNYRIGDVVWEGKWKRAALVDKAKTFALEMALRGDLKGASVSMNSEGNSVRVLSERTTYGGIRQTVLTTSVLLGFHVEAEKGPAGIVSEKITVDPGRVVRFSLVFLVKRVFLVMKDENLDPWQLQIRDELPMPLKVSEPAATNR
jgi:dipeptidyl aminopeptidase/acylaminoacyl peptidase